MQNADYGSPLHYGTGTLWLDGFLAQSCSSSPFLSKSCIFLAFLTHSQCLLQGGLYWAAGPDCSEKAGGETG